MFLPPSKKITGRILALWLRLENGLSGTIGSMGGEMMGPLSMQDMKGGFFLIASFVLLATICAIAALGTLMRPQRWCERETRLHV